MNKTYSIQPYKHEDELVSIPIGKPGAGEGAFLAVEGNIQIGIIDSDYSITLLPLLEAIVEEKTDGMFRFYKGHKSEYHLQCMGLIIEMSNQTSVALRKHARLIFDDLY